MLVWGCYYLLCLLNTVYSDQITLDKEKTDVDVRSLYSHDSVSVCWCRFVLRYELIHLENLILVLAFTVTGTGMGLGTASLSLIL